MSRKHENTTAIVMREPGKLKPYDKNPRKHSQPSIDILCETIEKKGFTRPIEIDQYDRIIAGHGGTLAAIQLQKPHVPCFITQVENDQDYIERVVSDNKVGELSSWDNKMLKECMELLGDIKSIDIPSFDAKEIDKIFGLHHETKSSTKSASFGDGNEVTEGDNNALVKKKTFAFTEKEFKYVTNKLKAVKKEHGLDSEAEALIKALEHIKGLTKIERKPGPVTKVQ